MSEVSVEKRVKKRNQTIALLMALLCIFLGTPLIYQAYQEDKSRSDLLSPDSATRREELKKLMLRRDPSAVTAFQMAVNDEDPVSRVIALHGLTYMDEKNCEKYIRRLIEMLASSDYEVRGYVLGALGEIGHKMAVPALRKFENDPDRITRLTALLALARCGDNPQNRLISMVKMLDDPDWMVRQNALLAIAQLGPAGKQAVRIIAGMVQDKPWQVRLAVVEALYAIDPKNPHAVEAFRTASVDPEIRVRQRARAILRQLGKRPR